MKIAQRLYSTFWSNLSKNVSFGVLYPYRLTDVGEIWHEGGDLLHAKLHPHRYNESALRGKKPQNLTLSNLNNRRFALLAMLPVKKFQSKHCRTNL